MSHMSSKSTDMSYIHQWTEQAQRQTSTDMCANGHE